MPYSNDKKIEGRWENIFTAGYVEKEGRKEFPKRIMFALSRFVHAGGFSYHWHWREQFMVVQENKWQTMSGSRSPSFRTKRELEEGSQVMAVAARYWIECHEGADIPRPAPFIPSSPTQVETRPEPQAESKPEGISRPSFLSAKRE